MTDDGRSGVAAVAALAEPTRRRVYDHVAQQPAPVDRDEVAAAVGLPRTTAAFHLDRLAQCGLLDVHFERRSGRTGPGAGRPSKLYRRAEASVAVTIPERHYDLAGDLLAGALAEADASGERPAVVLQRHAYRRGRQLGEDARDDGKVGRDGVLGVLEEQGYEPRPDGDAVVLGNCPFHRLARSHTQLVCGMNLHLLDGVLDAVPEAGLDAGLCPAEGLCCVRMHTAQPDGAVDA
jgi:predicted ArsR family transcriptional regulator